MKIVLEGFWYDKKEATKSFNSVSFYENIKKFLLSMMWICDSSPNVKDFSWFCIMMGLLNKNNNSRRQNNVTAKQQISHFVSETN